MSARTDLGKALLREWYDAAKSYPTPYNVPFDQFASMIDSQNPVFLESFGSAIEAAESNVGLDAVRKAVRNFALDGQGQLPTFPDGTPRVSVFFDVLKDVADPSLLNFDFVKEQAPKVVVGTLNEVKNVALTGMSIYLAFAALGIGAALYFARKTA